MKKILFVCLGNICRSPAAEGVMTKMIQEKGLEDQYWCDSAGTAGYHSGARADPRMTSAASQRGYDLTSKARRFQKKDFEEFDYILTMDESNYEDVMAQDSWDEYTDKVFRFRDFCTQHKIDGVPDPYYGGADGFDHVIDILEDGCANFLEKIQKGEI